MKTNFEYNLRRKGQRLADLKNKAVELERQLSDARLSFERELAQFAYAPETASPQSEETDGLPPEDWDPERELARMARFYATPGRSYGHAAPSPDHAARSRDSARSHVGARSGDGARSRDGARSPHHGSADPAGRTVTSEERTEVLVTHGRRTDYHPGLSRRSKVALAIAAVVVAVTVAVMMLAGGGASWPASVTTVQGQATQACQNPDVRSEPGQVNFACAKATRQILWVFALMTSGDNPDFADARTGRLGLEPITPGQGGEVAWSLNLHHPYDPANPVDSLAVAARAINNIIGGATLTGARGNPVIQPGLESSPANCARYTGSAAVTSRRGFPSLCARPVSSPAGQAALVADIYQKWVVGATPGAAQDAAILFTNAQNPGDPQVQAILKHLPNSHM